MSIYKDKLIEQQEDEIQWDLYPALLIEAELEKNKQQVEDLTTSDLWYEWCF